MIETYRFRTSLGYVVISFDPENFKTRIFKPHRNFRKNRDDENEERIITETPPGSVKVESGQECISQNYDGSVEWVTKAEDGSLWAHVDLSDGYYGSPEYLLEKIL